jgi:hypothetical protein
MIDTQRDDMPDTDEPPFLHTVANFDFKRVVDHLRRQSNLPERRKIPRSEQNRRPQG